MKKISILVPTYNEEANVGPLTDALKKLFRGPLKKYDYEILFIDNFSQDGTRLELEKICAADRRVKAVFNAKNFGHIKSPFYGMLQTTGDCTVGMAADFQDPPEMIVRFVKEWENGYKIVTGKKHKSKENPLMFAVRKLYYKFMQGISETDHLEQFTGFGLYDRQFVDIMRGIDDPMPYMRGLVGELGFAHKEVEFTQPKRRAGRTKNNWYTLYDMAMLGITSYSKIVMRMATICGFIVSGISFLVALYYLVMKLVYWDRFPLGTAPIIIAIFFLGSVQLFFIGFLGEYILNINTRVMKRPLVIEEKRINLPPRKAGTH